MENILKIINELKLTNSNKEKQMILENNKDNELLRKVLRYTYDGFKKYGITDKVFKNYSGHLKVNESLFDLLDELSNENINDELREKVVSFVNSQDLELKDLLEGIFCKDLKIGMSEKSINKVFKNLIPEFNVQLAITLDKSKFENEDFWITEKFDGIRCVCIILNKDDIKFFSRNGKEIIGLNDLKENIKEYKKINNIKDKTVLDGELLKLNINNITSGDLYRETVSIVNSKLEDKRDIEFNVFDIIDYTDFSNGKSKEKYKERRAILNSYKNLCLVKKAEVLYHGKDKNKIYDLLKEVDSQGKEGLMVNLDDYYVTKRNKSLIKCKTMLTADVLVVDVCEGTGKNKGKLGNIIVEFEYENKRYRCDVGSGFSDEERAKYYNDYLKGKIVEIQYFEVSKNKNGDVSLRFPVWRSIIRNDKTEISMW